MRDSEPRSNSVRQPCVSRVLSSVVGLLLVLCACDDSSGSIASPRLTSSSADPAAVLVQLGDYHLGAVPDMYVTGPELVIYGDGTTFAELYAGASEGRAQFRLATGNVPSAALQDLLATANTLPSATPIGEAAVDAFPLVLIVGEHRWEINDLDVQPFASFLADLRATVDAAATEPWQPSRWIDRPYESDTCTVIDRPGDDSLYDAPVYPHLLDEYPLGATACRP